MGLLYGGSECIAAKRGGCHDAVRTSLAEQFDVFLMAFSEVFAIIRTLIKKLF
jgi:hypothetical protein